MTPYEQKLLDDFLTRLRGAGESVKILKPKRLSASASLAILMQPISWCSARYCLNKPWPQRKPRLQSCSKPLPDMMRVLAVAVSSAKPLGERSRPPRPQSLPASSRSTSELA